MSRTAQPVFLGLYNGSPFSLHPRRSRRIFLIASPRLSPSRSPPFSLPHSFVVPRPSPISRLSTLASTIRLCSGSRVAFYEATPAVRSGTPAPLLLSLPRYPAGALCEHTYEYDYPDGGPIVNFGFRSYTAACAPANARKKRSARGCVSLVGGTRTATGFGAVDARR